MAGAMILDVVSAFNVRPGDPWIELIEKAVHAANQIVSGVHLGAYHLLTYVHNPNIILQLT